jgi:hypothetical protein
MAERDSRGAQEQREPKLEGQGSTFQKPRIRPAFPARHASVDGLLTTLHGCFFEVQGIIVSAHWAV